MLTGKNRTATCPVACSGCEAGRPAPGPERRTPAEWADYFGKLLFGGGSLCLGDPPEPYAAAMAQAPRRPVPEDTPGYDPCGLPPEGYTIALARERSKR